MLSGFSSFLKRHTAIVSLLGIALALPTAYGVYVYLKRTQRTDNGNGGDQSGDRRGKKLNELRGKLVSVVHFQLHIEYITVCKAYIS